jgi:UDP-N-acetylmuramyl pentapeptide phosphotransferase/UDP-N-acetylglucosamine-1-phosphate transferase
MSPLTIVVSAFMIALVVMSGAFMGGAVIVAVPLAIAVIATLGFLDLRRRSKQAHSIQAHRQQAEGEGIEFNERDKETLVSE